VIYNCFCSPRDGHYQILQNKTYGDGLKQVVPVESFSDSLDSNCAFHEAAKCT